MPHSIAVSPDTRTVAVGNTTTYTAIGEYSDGNSEVITSIVSWTIADSAVADIQSIDDNVAVLGLSVCATQITATEGDVSDQAQLVVDEALPDTLEIINIPPPLGVVWARPGPTKLRRLIRTRVR